MRPGVAEAMRRWRRGAEEGIDQASEDLLGRAIEVTPKELGHLRETGDRTGIIEVEPGLLEERVFFSAIYAAAQHEGEAIMHRGGVAFLWKAKHHTTPGTGKKFLEGPLIEMASTYDRVIAASVRRELER